MQAAAILLLLAATAYAQLLNGNVYYDSSSQQYYFKEGPADPQNAVTWGTYLPTLNTTGWNELWIESKNTKYSDLQVAFAAGFLEGAFTWEEIYYHFLNMYDFYFNNDEDLYHKVVAWLKQQDAWARSQIKNAAKQDPSQKHYWEQVGFVFAQLDGLAAGYNSQSTSAKKLDWSAFAILNAVGDLLDLVNVINDIKFDNMSLHDLQHFMVKNSHCSALIKVTGDFSDLFAGHTSWFTYGAMIRIYKHYDLHYKHTATKATGVSFSSYPAFLESLDDYYITTTGLIVIETSLSILNKTLYEHVKTSSLLSWQRTILANRMAVDGESWASIYSQHNSGTYNNQWMVVDLNKFEPGTELKPGTLWIVEQIPGYIHADDQTTILNFGYWPSYNVPFYEDIYAMSGFLHYWEKYHSSSFSYTHCPRANIFRRDQGKVDSLSTMQAIQRYNDYENDPYADGNPGNAIASRFDLATGSEAGAFGGYDSKITNFANGVQRISFAISGPTYQQQPVFEWTEKFSSTSHLGQPERFDFPWITIKPKPPQ